jgi:hypothetical protein
MSFRYLRRAKAVKELRVKNSANLVKTAGCGGTVGFPFIKVNKYPLTPIVPMGRYGIVPY